MSESMIFMPAGFVESVKYTDIYDYYNIKYFGHRLPVVRVGFYKDCKRECGATVKLDGARYPAYIYLNAKLKTFDVYLRATLLHEMCHVKLLNRHGHGPKFKKELKRLQRIGAYDDIL